MSGHEPHELVPSKQVEGPEPSQTLHSSNCADPPQTLLQSSTALPPQSPLQSSDSPLGPAPSAQHPVFASGPEPPHTPQASLLWQEPSLKSASEL